MNAEHKPKNKNAEHKAKTMQEGDGDLEERPGATLDPAKADDGPGARDPWHTGQLKVRVSSSVGTSWLRHSSSLC